MNSIGRGSRRLICKRASAIMQYALIVGVVSLALAGMNIYVKRGMQGKVKQLTDTFIGGQQRVEAASTPTLTNSYTDSNSTVKKSYSGGVAKVKEWGSTTTRGYGGRGDEE